MNRKSGRLMPSERKPFIIKAATFNDVEAMTKVHVASRVDAYRGILKSVEKEFKQLDDFEKRWRERLLSNTNLVYVAEINRNIVGIAAVNISAQPLLSHLYIAPDYCGKGAGTLLCNEIFTMLRKNQYQSVVVWVIRNASAERFYKKMGFTTTRYHKVLDYCGELIDVLQYNKYLANNLNSH